MVDLPFVPVTPNIDWTVFLVIWFSQNSSISLEIGIFFLAAFLINLWFLLIPGDTNIVKKSEIFFSFSLKKFIDLNLFLIISKLSSYIKILTFWFLKNFKIDFPVFPKPTINISLLWYYKSKQFWSTFDISGRIYA